MAFSCSLPHLRPLAHHHGGPCHTRRESWLSSSKSIFLSPNTRPNLSCAISMSDGQSGDNMKIILDHMMDKAKKFWDKLPQPVKSFPWNSVRDNFIQVILDLAVAVIKYLSAPLLAVSSLSEMSYCAHERKLVLFPVPLALGFVVAGILIEKIAGRSPVIKDAEAPWHLIAIAILFTLVKLPGPYYPYWGRIFIPHFANGGLLRVFWMIYLWYRRSKDAASMGTQRTAKDEDLN